MTLLIAEITFTWLPCKPCFHKSNVFYKQDCLMHSHAALLIYIIYNSDFIIEKQFPRRIMKYIKCFFLHPFPSMQLK